MRAEQDRLDGRASKTTAPERELPFDPSEPLAPIDFDAFARRAGKIIAESALDYRRVYSRYWGI